jgi:hypothetical protein
MLFFQHAAAKVAHSTQTITMRYHSTPQLARALSAILGLLLFIGAPAARAQEIPTPPDLWNLATGEKIPGADVLKTRDFGAISQGAPPDVQRMGFFRVVVVEHQDNLQPNDIILAVDGLRIYGWREFELARFRDPLATNMTLLINRKGDLHWLKYHDLQPGRSLGAGFDIDAEHDRILNAMESLGLPLADEKVRQSLMQLPAQSALELDQWSKQAPPNPDTAWLQDFIDLYTAVQGRHYANAVKPAHEPPIPYFKRLEAFYLTLADENKAKEVPPDLKASGEVPEFYTLALPVPGYLPPLGNLKFSDRRFQALLLRKYALGDRPDQEITMAAQKYATSGSDGLDLYIDQVRASLLDPDRQGILPYRNNLLQNPTSRTLMAQALSDRMKDPDAIDWPINAYAMIALDWATGNYGAIAPTVSDLGKRSPYLARLAMGGLYFIRHAERNRWRYLNAAMNVMAKNRDFLGPDVPVLYTWAISKVQPVALSLGMADGNKLADPYWLLTAAPYADLVALKAGSSPAPSPAPADATGASPSPAAQPGQ